MRPAAALFKRIAQLTGRSEVDEAEDVAGIQQFSAQHVLSRRFRDEELETEYGEDIFKARCVVLRCMNYFLAGTYLLNLLDIVTKWGSLVGKTRTDLAQYYIPLFALLGLTGLMHTRYYTARSYGPIFFCNGVLLMVCHTAPSLLASSAGTLAPSTNATAAAVAEASGAAAVAAAGGMVELVALAAWFVSKSVSYLLAIVIFCPDLVTSVCLFAVVLPLYYLKARLEWDALYSFDISSLTPNIVLSTVASLLFIWMSDYVRRRQFVLLKLLRRSTSERIEQLAREKERLEYERRFAEKERQFAERALLYERSASPEKLADQYGHGDDYDAGSRGGDDDRTLERATPPSELDGDGPSEDFVHLHHHGGVEAPPGACGGGMLRSVGRQSHDGATASSFGTCSELGANGSSHSEHPPARRALGATAAAAAAALGVGASDSAATPAPAAVTAAAAAVAAAAAAPINSPVMVGDGTTPCVAAVAGEQGTNIVPWSKRPLWRRIGGSHAAAREMGAGGDAESVSSFAGSSAESDDGLGGHETPVARTCASRDAALNRTLADLSIDIKGEPPRNASSSKGQPLPSGAPGGAGLPEA
jgi:hypothetical protein